MRQINRVIMDKITTGITHSLALPSMSGEFKKAWDIKCLFWDYDESWDSIIRIKEVINLQVGKKTTKP